MTHDRSWGKGVQPESSPYHLPVHPEAERAVVGAVLARNTAFDEVNALITDAHFSDPVLARIWAWIVQSMANNKPASVKTLQPNMAKFTKLEPSHPEYLTPEEADEYLEVLTAASSIISMPRLVEGNANIVRDYACRREIMKACIDGLDKVGAATTDIDSTVLARELLDKVSRVEATGQTSTGSKTLAQAVDGALRIIEEAQIGEIGLPTGVLSLDRHIGGLRKGKFYIIAGRPAMGKSILGFQILRNAAGQCLKEGKGVALGISFEMSAEDIAQRYLADLASITIDKQLEQKTAGGHAQRMASLEEAAEQLEALPMIINDDPPPTIAGLISYVKRIHRETVGGVRILVVDYLQLMGGGGGGGRGDAHREQIVSEISRGLKQISRELKIPVIGLAQLNRGVEQREDKRPKLSDLRESGAMEQDADCVMFVYREAYYLSQEEPQTTGPEYGEWLDRMDKIKDESDIIIAKLRQGKPGTIKQHFDGAHFTFQEPKSKAA